MPKKPGHETVESRAQSRTLSNAAVRRALARATPELAADEEKVLRMRSGAMVPRPVVLERVGQDHPDSREKLLSLELELLRQWRERQTQVRPDPHAQVAVPPVAAAQPNPRREGIVRALKAKKPSRSRS